MECEADECCVEQLTVGTAKKARTTKWCECAHYSHNREDRQKCKHCPREYGPGYFYNEDRYNEHIEDLHENNKKFGTVGAVAIDKNGNIAAGTSTGGMNNKRFGRVGDVPVIGAGTYAENGVGGLSATGHGEYFIRNVATYDIAAQVKYGASTLDEAGYHTLMEKLKNQGGDGGVIGLDKDGMVVIHFNTVAMPRGYINDKGETVVKIDQE